MNTTLKLVVCATLLLAAGSWALPADANEVIIADDVTWFDHPYVRPQIDTYQVRCTQTSNLMCVALVNYDADTLLDTTAVVSSPTTTAGKAWAERVQPNDFRVHCFQTQGNRKSLMKAYVSASLNTHATIPYELHAQCWSGSPGDYTTRATSVEKTDAGFQY